MVSKKQPIIKLKSVHKTYGEYGVVVNALDNVCLDIFKGEFVSIIGPSGSGKSTLLHCMGLLDRPTKGEILVDGKNTSEISGKEIAQFRGEKLGFVFQSYNLIPRLTALENVILPGIIMQKESCSLEKKAAALLKEVGIAHRADHKGIHLSGGEQQRVAIARSLINDPVLVLADEPTGALDTKSSEEIMHILLKINKKRGATTVFVSHDLEVAQYGERILIIKDGKIVGDIKNTRDDFKKAAEILKSSKKGRG
jgi:putative ABC transport system ATP-binding protein